MEDTLEQVTPEIANHVLYYLIGGEGHSAGSFTASLIRLWSKADAVNETKLASAYPGYGTAVRMYRDGAVEELRRKAIY